MVYLITSGAMQEKIDQVRSIINTSSGKTGASIADFLASDNQVIYLHTQTAKLPKNDLIELKCIDSVIDLDQMLKYYLAKHQEIVVIHAMAVSDFKVSGTIILDKLITNILENQNNLSKERIIELINTSTVKQNKLASNQDTMINLAKNPKIIGNIKKYNPQAKLVGFKLLANVDVDTLISVALNQQIKNNCDLVVANRLEDVKANHRAYVLKNKKEISKCESNLEIAKTIKEMLGE